MWRIKGPYSTGKIETKIKVVERRRRRREQILVEFKERSYWKLKAELVYLISISHVGENSRTRVGKCYGPVVRPTRDDENDDGDMMTYVRMDVCMEACIFYLLLFCMLHYYGVILRALVVSYIIT